MNAPTARLEAYAVFQGGGVRGVALAGAVNSAMTHVNIVGVGGTSAGSMIAVLLAVGYKPPEILQMMLEVDSRRFAKRRIIPWRYGLLSSKFLFTWLSQKLAQKIEPDHGDRVTFEHPDLRYPVKIVVANIRDRKVKICSKNTTPEMGLAHAARLSMSIPFIYESLADEEGRYVDGGIISNFPIWLYDAERRDATENTIVLGFTLEETVAHRPIRGPYSFASAVVSTSLLAQRRLLEKYHYHPSSSTIKIPTGSISTTDFKITKQEIQKLYSAGESATTQFFEGAMQHVPPSVTKANPLDDVDLAQPAEVVSAIALSHVSVASKPTNVGTYTQIDLRYYIDLMEACLIPPRLDALAKALVDHTKMTIDSGQMDFNVVAGHKRSNPLLVSAVAKQLDARAILILDWPDMRLGYPFEGRLHPKDSVLLVDDVSSDGTLLRSSVQKLRRHGQVVSHVATLVDRTEGNADEVLLKVGCNLHAVCALDDERIESLLQRVASG